jgi:hypothetical protein
LLIEIDDDNKIIEILSQDGHFIRHSTGIRLQFANFGIPASSLFWYRFLVRLSCVAPMLLAVQTPPGSPAAGAAGVLQCCVAGVSRGSADAPCGARF